MARKKKSDVTSPGLPPDYPAFLESLKRRVQQAQTRAMLSVNRELIKLYWDIGREIARQQEHEGWGKGVVDRLAKDIQRAFPGLQGFSSLNIWPIQELYLAFHLGPAIPSQPVTELAPDGPPAPVVDIPWGTNQTPLAHGPKISSPNETKGPKP